MKTIPVKEETWTMLTKMKYSEKCKNMDVLLKRLVDYYNRVEEGG